ncbi:MAG: epimerase [Bacteroidetes bacterium CG_4_10_14_3_um_filter_31_20]|nr:NAD-dependent epimerase/dehydratase family protein [Bacteroidota bacterium]PIY02319.1 MAG: epimerase [Bacteroidetes bacterium CG_4_10_14_3_um_filter_31_20]
MTNILITGGAGFIGSTLTEFLISNVNNFVVIVDDLSTGNVKKLPTPSNNLKFIKADVNNRKEISEIMMSWRFDYVFHYAAVVGVQNTLENPIKVLNDVNGFKNILELSKNIGVKRVFFSSSSEIYGEPVEYPQNELTTPLNSRLPYAIVKNIGEAYLRSYKQEFDLDYTIFRFFNTYGAKQSKNFVISKFLIHALKNEDIPIYGDGLQTRTFCYVDDNVKATINAFNKNLYVNDVVNIGGENEITILDLAKTIIEITGSSSKIMFMPPLKEGDMRGRHPDTTKMKALTDAPLLPLKDGLKKILEQGLFELNNL